MASALWDCAAAMKVGRRHVRTQIDHVESGNAKHHGYDVLADLVDVAPHRTDDDRAELLSLQVPLP